MFSLSECVIEFQTSPIYRRLMLTLYSMAVFLMLASGLPVWLKGVLTGCMLMMSIHVYRQGRPYPQFDVLSIRAGACLLTFRNKTVEEYMQCRVLVNCGLFFLLELSALESRRVIVIFFDHIDMDCYRTICFLEKIQ